MPTVVCTELFPTAVPPNEVWARRQDGIGADCLACLCCRNVFNNGVGRCCQCHADTHTGQQPGNNDLPPFRMTQVQDSEGFSDGRGADNQGNSGTHFADERPSDHT